MSRVSPGIGSLAHGLSDLRVSFLIRIEILLRMTISAIRTTIAGLGKLVIEYGIELTYSIQTRRVWRVVSQWGSPCGGPSFGLPFLLISGEPVHRSVVFLLAIALPQVFI